MNPAPMNVVNAPTPHSSAKVIMAILITAIVVGLGTYFLSRPTQTQIVATVTDTSTPLSTTAAPAPSNGFQTYTNAQFGYSVRYPADWQVSLDESNSDFQGFMPKNAGDYQITVKESSKTIAQIKASEEPFTLPNFTCQSSTVKFGVNTWTKIVCTSTIDHATVLTHYLAQPRATYWVTGAADTAAKLDTLNQFVASFTF